MDELYPRRAADIPRLLEITSRYSSCTFSPTLAMAAAIAATLVFHVLECIEENDYIVGCHGIATCPRRFGSPIKQTGIAAAVAAAS